MGHFRFELDDAVFREGSSDLELLCVEIWRSWVDSIVLLGRLKLAAARRGRFSRTITGYLGVEMVDAGLGRRSVTLGECCSRIVTEYANPPRIVTSRRILRWGSIELMKTPISEGKNEYGEFLPLPPRDGFGVTASAQLLGWSTLPLPLPTRTRLG